MELLGIIILVKKQVHFELVRFTRLCDRGTLEKETAFPKKITIDSVRVLEIKAKRLGSSKQISKFTGIYF